MLRHTSSSTLACPIVSFAVAGCRAGLQPMSEASRPLVNCEIVTARIEASPLKTLVTQSGMPSIGLPSRSSTTISGARAAASRPGFGACWPRSAMAASGHLRDRGLTSRPQRPRLAYADRVLRIGRHRHRRRGREYLRSRHPNDRLLLGMKGTMSELELSLFRQRSQEALEEKARRGALFLGVAAGYVKTARDRIENDPDQRVRSRRRLSSRSSPSSRACDRCTYGCARKASRPSHRASQCGGGAHRRLSGLCHGGGGLVAEEHDENQLLGISVPSGDHSPGHLALSPVHAQLRDVEDLLAERGIVVSYETIRRWVNHFGPIIAGELRKRRPKTAFDLASGRGLSENRWAHGLPVARRRRRGRGSGCAGPVQAQQARRVETDAQTSKEIRRRS